MPQATKEDLLWARSGKKKIIGVSWSGSPSRDRIPRTKRRGMELLEVWKDWKLRQGWTVLGTKTGGCYRAYPPGVEPGLMSRAEFIVLRAFDPETMQSL